MKRSSYIPRKRDYIFYIFILKQHICKLLGVHYPREIIGEIIRAIYAPIRIHCGANQSCIMTNYGTYVWGRNDYGQLMLGDNFINQFIPQRLDLNIQNAHTHTFIIDVNWGEEQTVVTTDTEIYYRGIADPDYVDSDDDNEIKSLSKYPLRDIKQSSCGNYFIVALTNSGIVYTWGSNTNGELGHDHRTGYLEEPLRLFLKDAIESIHCGRTHTIALTRNRSKMYVWGAHHKGQLGLGLYAPNRCTPTELVIDKQIIIEISCGAYHSVALSADGIVYVWGSNESGQLGLTFCHSRLSPEKLELDNIISICCGGLYTMFLTSDGNLYSCGNNKDGQLGLADSHFYNTNSPEKILLQDIISVKCGLSHTIAMTSEEEIYVWGNNLYGQLGSTGSGRITVPMKLSNI